MQISDTQFEPDSGLRLAENEVHLWRIELDAVAPAESRWRSFLSSDEIMRADRFHFARDRQTFTAARACLRILLGRYSTCDPRALRFVYGKWDKPSLDRPQAPGEIQFNISHSGKKAVITIARGREVGVDIEQVRDNFDHQALARRFFSPAEQQALASLPASEKCDGFFRCWTRKEAYIKAHGSGLTLALHSFDVSLLPGERPSLLATRPDPEEATRWSLCEVDAGPGYQAALCVRGHDWILRS